ncbi:MAG TPA: CDP-diacylglycerol--glycerol-3-phosphate 3-phosphatidyltransferase [Longimicrobiales bacterium]
MIKRSTIPNVITVARILMAPIVMWLIFVPTFTARLIAFILFLIAAFSDLIDGHLARKHGWISDFGKLLDPIADKLLLFTTVLPFYLLSHRSAYDDVLPIIRVLPLWIVLIVFGRELLITGIRAVAARRGIVIPAGKAGKHKAVWQNIFIGTTIFWYALRSAALDHGWQTAFWSFWQKLHGAVFIISLTVAVILTVYSLVVYLWSWRKLTTAL